MAEHDITRVEMAEQVGEHTVGTVDESLDETAAEYYAQHATQMVRADLLLAFVLRFARDDGHGQPIVDATELEDFILARATTR
jgi:hypothetical protein